MGKRDRFDSYKDLRGFLFLNARNKCFNYLRNQKARSAIDKQIGDFTIAEQRSILFAEIESELVTHIQEEVEKLPDYYRNILKLAYFQGYDNQEIADMLQISEKTVRNAKSIALKTVKMAFLNRNTKMTFYLYLSCYYFLITQFIWRQGNKKRCPKISFETPSLYDWILDPTGT